MIWGFLTVLVIGLILLFAAPFLDFLTPENTIWLVDVSNSNEPIFLAEGAETLWFHWQSWIYIFLFCLSTVLILGAVYNTIRTVSDEALAQSKQKWIQKTEELEQLKREYRKQVEQDVLHEYSKEAEDLKHREQALYNLQNKISEQKRESRERMKMANKAVRRQQAETQSKLGQRDRLREEKKRIAEFLEQKNYQFSDGSKVTYSSLKALAKQHHNEEGK